MGAQKPADIVKNNWRVYVSDWQYSSFHYDMTLSKIPCDSFCSWRATGGGLHWVRGILFFLLLIGFGLNANAQAKVNKILKSEKSVTAPVLKKNTNIGLDTEPDLGGNRKTVLDIRQSLVDEYQNSDQNQQKTMGSIEQKHILNVGWFDTDFNKIETTSKAQPISIAVLTQGYAIGDAMEITIDSTDGKSLIAGRKCKEITFLGTVNYENLALLQNLFSVQGKTEQLIIDPKWQDRHICK